MPQIPLTEVILSFLSFFFLSFRIRASSEKDFGLSINTSRIFCSIGVGRHFEVGEQSRFPETSRGPRGMQAPGGDQGQRPGVGPGEGGGLQDFISFKDIFIKFCTRMSDIFI